MNAKIPEDHFHKKPTSSGIYTGKASTLTNQEIPKSIGPYKIESLLDKGGMSVLYLATHPISKEPITVKVLSPRLLSHPEAVIRLMHEADIIGMTDHPNIVKLYGRGEWEGGPYIAMEFIQGISLREAILQSPISLKRALEIVLDIAYALCHLHSQGIIHRDLKPENILITEGDQIKVIDFGIAQLLAEKNPEKPSEKKRLIGTPIYMSPEQRENPESASYPSDIYSLGIIIYEVILGKLSHGQIHLSLMPKGIQKILSKALQPKPEDRYHDAVDLINDISIYLNSSNMQKEKKTGDRLSELSENFRLAQSVLTPEKLSDSDAIEYGIATQKLMNIYGIYCDSFKLPNGGYGILIAESSTKGAEGVIYMAILRGMIRALKDDADKPLVLITKLNALITKDKIDQILTLSYLKLSPSENRLYYISCGYSGLWKLPASSEIPIPINANNIALGVDENAEFHQISTPWKIGDTLILHSLAAEIVKSHTEPEASNNLLQQALQENADSTPQKIVDAIFRKIMFASKKPSYDRSLMLIGIRRKE